MIDIANYDSPVFLVFGVPLIGAAPNNAIAAYDVLARIISNRSVWPLTVVPGEELIQGPLSGPRVAPVRFSTRPTRLVYSLGEDYWTFPSRATSLALLYQALDGMRVTDAPKGENPVMHSNLSGEGTLIESPFDVSRGGMVSYNTDYFGGQAPGHWFHPEPQSLAWSGSLGTWPQYYMKSYTSPISLINLGDWAGETSAQYGRYVLPNFRAVAYSDLAIDVASGTIRYKMVIGAVPGPNPTSVWSNTSTFLVEHLVSKQGWQEFTTPAFEHVPTTTRRHTLVVKTKYRVVDRVGNQAVVGETPDTLAYTTKSSEPVVLHRFTGVGTPDVNLTGKLYTVTREFQAAVHKTLLADLSDLVAYSTADAVKKHAFADGNLLEFLAEFGGLVQTLPDIRSLLELLRSTPVGQSITGSLKDMARYLSSENLRYKFGLAPNIQLLQELGTTLSRIDKAALKFSESTWYGSHSLLLADGLYKGVGPAKVSIKTTIKWNEGHLPLSGTGAEFLGLNVAGLTPLFSNLWDLVPWSFAVDWLLQIGSMLSRFESMALLSALQPRVLIHTIKIGAPLTEVSLHGDRLFKTYFRRYVSKFVPGFPRGPLAEPKLSLRDLTLPLSLIASR